MFTDGTIHVATWSTRQPGGFTPKQFADLESVIAPLARVAEIRALRRTSENLIDTYVGHQTGERILAGKIRRGYVEAIRAAIWLSDMRGFTASVGAIAAAGIDRSLEPLFRLSGSGRARSRRRSAQIHGRRPVGDFSDRQREMKLVRFASRALSCAQEFTHTHRRTAAGRPRTKRRSGSGLRFTSATSCTAISAAAIGSISPASGRR